MAHYAILAPEAAGHLMPMCSVGRELQELGHRVTVVAREKAGPMAARFGLGFVELDLGGVPAYRGPARAAETIAGAFGLGYAVGLRARLRHMAIWLLERAPGALADLAVDGLLIDQNLTAGGTVAERMGIPFVTICSALHWHEEVSIPPHFTGWPYSDSGWAKARNRLGYAAWHGFMRPILGIVNRYRGAWGLGLLRHPDDSFSPLAQIGQTCAELDFPRRELPEVFHYVGSLAEGRPGRAVQFPWDRLDGRPLVYACMGTVQRRANATVLRKVATACAGLDVQLVISLGRWAGGKGGGDRGLGDLSGDPLVVDFAPQVDILEKACLLVTHAGINTVMEAASRGVVMLALPRNGDQMGMGARLEHAGVGLRASFHRCEPEELRGLVVRLMGDAEFRRRARLMRRAVLGAGGARRAAAIVERALMGRRPVTRESLP